MVDMIVHRQELRDTLIRVIHLLRHPTPSANIVTLPAVATDAAATEVAVRDSAVEERTTDA